MIEYVCGFLFDPYFEKVALITKEKPEWQKGKLNGIGGKVEGIETQRTAMEREFREETGIEINRHDWIPLADLNDGDAKIYFFYFNSPEIKNLKSIEKEQVGIYEVKTIPELITIPNLKWLIPMCLDNNHQYARCITHKTSIK